MQRIRFGRVEFTSFQVPLMSPPLFSAVPQRPFLPVGVKVYPLTLVVLFGAATPWARAESVKEEALKLMAKDVKSDGKTVPKGAKPKLGSAESDKKHSGEIDPELLVLPKIEVTTPRMSDLDRKLAELEKEQSREDKSTTPSALDSVINNPKISILGAENAKARAARAAQRVEIMNWERILTIALAVAKTPEERAQIQYEIRMLKGLRR